MTTDSGRCMKNGRCAFVVLGMHRSGTSLLTRLLAFAGAELPKSIIPPKVDNPKGFWESFVLNAFNDKLLLHLGCSWHEMGMVNVSKLINAELLIQEAIDVLQSEFGHAQLFVVKDPRICRLMPFWIEVFNRMGIEIKILIPFRSPVDTANSLKRRDGFSIERGAWLWLRHLLDAEKYSRGCSRVFIDYNHLLNDWRYALEVISLKLNIDLMTPAIIYKDQIDQFIEPDISRATGYQLEAPLADEISSVYEWALKSVDGNEESCDLLDGVHDLVSRIDHLIVRPMGELISAQETQIRRLVAEMDAARDSALQHEMQIERAQNDNTDLSNQLDNARMLIDALVQEIDEARTAHKERDLIESMLRNQIMQMEHVELELREKLRKADLA